MVGTPSLTTGVIPGTETFNDVVDTIGRVGLRVGTSFGFGALSLQPFASASVWHDFAGNATATFKTCPGCVVVGPNQAVLTDAFSGTNIGTYGQYSLGVSAAIANTGWIGFVRADYRDGPNLSGWDGTGGIRYQFTPGEVAPRSAPGSMPVKAPPPVRQAVSWDGLYVGAVAGAEQGTARFGYGSGSVDPHVAGILGGFDLGYNWQHGAWVYGLEGEWDLTDARGGIGCGPPAVALPSVTPSPLFATNCNAEQSWIASVTPRLGYAWDRALFYVKGGLAFTREHYDATCDFGARNALLFFGGQACAPVAPTSFF